jgi:hypothetical protein
LDGEEVRTAILEALSDDAETSLQEDVGREGHRDKVGFRQQDAGGKERQRMQGQVRKVLEAIEADAADLVLWVGEDGVVAMRSVLVRLSVFQGAGIRPVSSAGKERREV